LAEGLRVQAFWHLGNVHDSAADHTLAHQRCGLGWVKIYLRLLHLRAMATQVSGGQSLVTHRWVDDQAGWFKKQNRCLPEKMQRCSPGPRASSSTPASSAVPFSLWHAFSPFERCFLLDSGLLKVCLGFLPAAGGRGEALPGVLRQGKSRHPIRANEPHLQTRRSHLHRATPAQVPVILFELGRKALDENGTWLLMNREREVKLPD